MRGIEENGLAGKSPTRLDAGRDRRGQFSGNGDQVRSHYNNRLASNVLQGECLGKKIQGFAGGGFPAHGPAGEPHGFGGSNYGCGDARLPLGRFHAALHRCPAAIDRQDNAGDEGRFCRRKEQRGAGDLFGLANAAEESAFNLPLVKFRAGFGRDASGDRARADGVAADVFGAEITSDTAGQTDQAMLDGGIGRRVASADKALDGTDIDDRAAARAAHERQSGSNEISSAEQRNVHGLLPFGIGRRGNIMPLRRDIGGVVAKHINATAFGRSQFDGATDLRGSGDVAFNKNGIPAGFTNVCGCLRTGFGIKIHDEYLRAFLREQGGDRPADAVRSAGDDGNFILKSHRV